MKKLLFLGILCILLFVGTIPRFSYADSMSPLLPQVYPDVTVKLVEDSTDTVRNPYAPPIKYSEETYTQLGYLSRGSAKHILFGKPAHYRRDKWYYYTMIDNIKLYMVLDILLLLNYYCIFIAISIIYN